jgi:cephalosporin hydroxylase
VVSLIFDAEGCTLVVLDWIHSRLRARDGIPLAYDNAVVALAQAALSCRDTELRRDLFHELRELVAVSLDTSDERLQPAAERLREIGSRRDVSPSAYACGQGVQSPFMWRGQPVFKNVWDLAIYQQLLMELRPRTLIELGSGTGGSALWLHDIAVLAAGSDARVTSFDIRPPKLVEPGISYVAADLSDPALGALHTMLSPDLPRPWLVSEDAHVNTLGLLRFFDPLLAEGDYLIVEDSPVKQDMLRSFVDSCTGKYCVDTRYTDYFGINVTSAMNSILVRA